MVRRPPTSTRPDTRLPSRPLVRSAPVFSQSVTGAVVGRADAGAQVTITNPETGYTRTVTAGSDGNYRLALLPPGTYMVQSGSGEPIQVGVTLGNSTTVNLAAGTTTLGTTPVVGSRVVHGVGWKMGRARS